jgi:hypothetical protein
MTMGVKVVCIAEEYAYVSSHPCKCGGDWQVKKQTLATSKESPHIKLDFLFAQCKKCGADEDFFFVVDTTHALYEPNWF